MTKYIEKKISLCERNSKNLTIALIKSPKLSHTMNPIRIAIIIIIYTPPL